MFDLNNSCMEFKIHLMCEYWNTENCLGNMVRLAYKICLIDTGLGRNIFGRDYKKLHKLAEKCWFEYLWRLCDFLQVKIVLNKAHYAQPVSKSNKGVMDTIIETSRYKGDELVSIRACRKFKTVHMISCLVRCDGSEVMQDIQDNNKGKSRRQFPLERLTPKMLATSNEVVELIASDTVNSKHACLTPWQISPSTTSPYWMVCLSGLTHHILRASSKITQCTRN